MKYIITLETNRVDYADYFFEEIELLIGEWDDGEIELMRTSVDDTYIEDE